MKEMDLRCKKIGSYEFSFDNDDDINANPDMLICKIPHEDDYKYSFYFKDKFKLSRISIKTSPDNVGSKYIEIVSKEEQTAHFLI